MENSNVLGEEYVYDLCYVQAPTLKELEKKVRQKLEKDWEPVEQNPFLDTTVNPPLWTQLMLQMDYDDGSDNKKE